MTGALSARDMRRTPCIARRVPHSRLAGSSRVPPRRPDDRRDDTRRDDRTDDGRGGGDHIRLRFCCCGDATGGERGCARRRDRDDDRSGHRDARQRHDWRNDMGPTAREGEGEHGRLVPLRRQRADERLPRQVRHPADAAAVRHHREAQPGDGHRRGGEQGAGGEAGGQDDGRHGRSHVDQRREFPHDGGGEHPRDRLGARPTECETDPLGRAAGEERLRHPGQ